MQKTVLSTTTGLTNSKGRLEKNKPRETEHPHRRGTCPVNHFTTISRTPNSQWSITELLSLAMWIQQNSSNGDYLQIFQSTEEKALSFTYSFLLYVFASLLFSFSFPPVLIMLKHLCFNSRKVLSNPAQIIFTNEKNRIKTWKYSMTKNQKIFFVLHLI